MARKEARRDPALEAVHAAWKVISAHPLFAPMASEWRVPQRQDQFPRDGWGTVDSNGQVRVHSTRRASAEEWTWVFAHLLIHLGLGHADPDRPAPDAAAGAACDVAVNRFLGSLKIGRPVVELPPSYPGTDEDALARQWRRVGVPAEYCDLGVAGAHSDVLIAAYTGWGDPPKWEERFAAGLSAAATAAVDVAGGARTSLSDSRSRVDVWDSALGWFVSSYPLLGAMAACMKVVADVEVARGWDIHVAAVNAAAGRST